MMGRIKIVVLVVSLFLGTWVVPHNAQLSYNYYKASCPNAEGIVRRELLRISLLDSTAPAAFLRLLFHDCQVQGCDASILLDVHGPGTDSEMKSYRNFAIRKREAVEQIKSALEAECPGKVSCADIIAMAARESVSLSGGPRIGIPLGRKDVRTCSHQRADSYLPSPSISVDGFLQTFVSKGMSLEESVAILGAHTLGVGHCLNIVDRLYNPAPTDRMNIAFRARLRLKCPTRIPLDNITFVSNDLTPGIFDNQYFVRLLAGKGLFHIDANIAADSRTLPIIRNFAADQNYFFRVFSTAFVKLSLTNVLSPPRGEVRRQCSHVN
ncbi:hypothetical protein MLD38_021065 [Melastoma candidum]|uniref:Uncharacterized protein n=1 Tax=Melastoma candidum TaxID=119954 RepID=A0ACB9QIB7_9MYRT|nr:hypothetical protein MLD38_021065 [Melastoma candidum]